MKRFLILFALVFSCSILPALEISVGVGTAPAAEEPVAEEVCCEETEVRPLYGMTRGVCNLCTCFLEVFRCSIYDNVELPLGGAFTGLLRGVSMTCARALSGVADIVTFGCTPRTLHPSMPDFVWEAEWIPAKSEQ